MLAALRRTSPRDSEPDLYDDASSVDANDAEGEDRSLGSDGHDDSPQVEAEDELNSAGVLKEGEVELGEYVEPHGEGLQASDTLPDEAADPSNNISAESKRFSTDSFEELKLSADDIACIRSGWARLVGAFDNQDVAGEMIYKQLFEHAPTMQPLFKTPRAAQAMRLMNALATIISIVHDPPQLKASVETLAFQHINYEVTEPRLAIFQDVVLELMSSELVGATKEEFDGWTALMTYIGGSFLFVKTHFTERIQIILTSWHRLKQNSQKAATRKKNALYINDHGTMEEKDTENEKDKAEVPTTFPEMFKFNAAVMGCGKDRWMDEVLARFERIVASVSDSARLQDECDIILLGIAKVARLDSSRSINLSSFKSCMLAALRSLLPKTWSSSYEQAWTWLWSNVQRLLERNMGKPHMWEQALTRFVDNLGDDEAVEIRRDVYNRFFLVAPGGQDYFKQSNAYLHLIAERVMAMTLEMFKDPVKMVDNISALGLRHVGYGIPTELFPPYVATYVEVLREHGVENKALEAFQWSLGLVSRMLVQAILEGSTIVMKAINVNSSKQLEKAIRCSPRGERAKWLLVVQVGAQSISPFEWAITNNALDAARACLKDLLTIRADCERYYYGNDDLFKRHPHLVYELFQLAPTLIPDLLDGLMWRSPQIEKNGMRRVNYYIRHLLICAHAPCKTAWAGEFSSTMGWFGKPKDPVLISHPVLVVLCDLIWNGIAFQAFLRQKIWFLVSLLVYITGQSVLTRLYELGEERPFSVRAGIAACRLFIYCGSMPHLTYSNTMSLQQAFRKKDVVHIMGVAVPAYIFRRQNASSILLVLSLLMMLVFEPLLWCLPHYHERLFDTECLEDSTVDHCYHFFAMMAMFTYYAMLLDLAVLSEAVSGYIVVLFRMTSHFGLFLMAWVFFVLAFSCATSNLWQQHDDFRDVPISMLTLLKISLRMRGDASYEEFDDEPALYACVLAFIIAVGVFLNNLLVAQMIYAYEDIHRNWGGFVRLERIEVIVLTVPFFSLKRWCRFRDSLRLTEPLELNAGDMGPSGGVQLLENARLHGAVQQKIKRYGGSTDPSLQWPKEDTENIDEETLSLQRLEKSTQKSLRKFIKSHVGSAANGNSAGTGSSWSEALSDGQTTSDPSDSSQVF